MAIGLMDIGNSRTKWSWIDDGGLGRSTVLSDGLPQPLIDCETLLIARTGAANRIPNGLKHHPQIIEIAVDPGCGGVRVAYPDPERLGVDRWLAMLAAWDMVRSSVMIVDAGTAITVDVLDGDGRHQGGWIAPGLLTMRESIASRTAHVGRGFAMNSGLWGVDTEQCVGYGTRRAMVGLVAEAAREFRQFAPNAPIIIAGGDADLLLTELESRVDNLAVDHELIFSGMAVWWHSRGCKLA